MAEQWEWSNQASATSSVEQQFDAVVAQLKSLPDGERDQALDVTAALARYLLTKAGGAGPVAVPPTPVGYSPTSGSFPCPHCMKTISGSYS